MTSFFACALRPRGRMTRMTVKPTTRAALSATLVQIWLKSSLRFIGSLNPVHESCRETNSENPPETQPGEFWSTAEVRG